MNAKPILALGGLMALVAVLSAAGRGGGGGARGGGGGVRSAPSVSRPSASHVSTPRPSAPSRSTTVSRPSAPISTARPDVRAPQTIQRPADYSVTRSSLDSRAVAPGVAARAGTSIPLSSVKPANYGSISRAGAAAGLAAAGVAGGAAVAARSGSGLRDVQTGQTPGGGNYVAIDGPRGEFGAIRGPGGNVAAGARGPGGEAAGFRGPRGNWVVDRVPDGCHEYYWGGHHYWNHGYYWYAPVWYGDDCYWEYRYPPTGYWYDDLPENCETVTVDNATYYVSDAMYFQAGAKDGKDGYVVAPPPATNSAGEALAVLQRTCDFLGSVTSFTAEVDVTMDRYLETGDKVPVASRRVMRVQQPNRMAIDFTGETQDQRMVYDGSTLTAIDRRDGRFSASAAPARLEDALPDLRAKRNLHMPFGDLLQRDAFDALALGVKDAEYVGVQNVGETECHHAAFTQDDLDWELWVKTGDQPLPMKIVVTYKKTAHSPRFTWQCLKWELNPAHPANAFTVELPTAQTIKPTG